MQSIMNKNHFKRIFCLILLIKFDSLIWIKKNHFLFEISSSMVSKYVPHLLLILAIDLMRQQTVCQRCPAKIILTQIAIKSEQYIDHKRIKWMNWITKQTWNFVHSLFMFRINGNNMILSNSFSSLPTFYFPQFVQWNRKNTQARIDSVSNWINICIFSGGGEKLLFSRSQKS